MQGKQQATQARMEKATRELMPAASAGDPAALQQLMSVNPDAGMQIQGMMAKQAAQTQQAEQFAQGQANKDRRFGLDERKLERDLANDAAGEDDTVFMQNWAAFDAMPENTPTEIKKKEQAARMLGAQYRGRDADEVVGIKQRESDIEVDQLKKTQAVKLATEPELRKAIAAATAEGALIGTDADRLKGMQARMPELEEMVDSLRELTEDATFTLAGRGVDAVAKQLGFSTEGANASQRYLTIVDNSVLPLLRETFGAAFTVPEQDALRATLGDVDATPPQKMAKLEEFMTNKRRQVRSLARKAAKNKAEAKEAQGGGPAVGDVVDGYEYVGGDKASPDSWKKK